MVYIYNGFLYSYKEEFNYIIFKKMEGIGDFCVKRKLSFINYVWCVCCYVGFRGKKGMKVKEGLYVIWEGGGVEVRLIGGVNRIKVCYMNAWKYYKEILYFV